MPLEGGIFFMKEKLKETQINVRLTTDKKEKLKSIYLL